MTFSVDGKEPSGSTDRKRVQEMLAESEIRYRSFFDNSLDALLLTSPDGSIFDVNPAACRMFGRTPEEIKRIGRSGLVNGTDSRLQEALQERARTGNAQAEITMVRADGTRFPADITSTVFKDAKGELKTSMIIRDVSAQKEVEASLRESERKFRFLTEKMTDIVWTMDRDFRTTYASPSLKNLLGFTLEERKRQSLEEMIAPESLERVRAMYLEELQADEKGAFAADRSATIEIEYYRKDGSTLWMENVVKWLRDPDGAIVGIYGVSRDISDRRLAEERREKLEAQLRQSQKMESVGRLAGGVAHDFNNMLGVILGHAELAMDVIDPAQPIYNDLHEIWKAARRSAELTRQLLTFARKQIVRPQVLDLNDTVSGMLRMLQRLIGENITLVWRPGAELWPVRIDPIQIDQILANLAVNARDAIVLPAGPDKAPESLRRQAGGTGNLTIATENILFDAVDCNALNGFTPGQYVRLTVSDDGCGMSQEALDNLFEPFFTTKEIGKGTGLGLATIYGIVKQNNGFINVYSEPEKGTTVKICFPAETAAAATRSEVYEKEPGRGDETILLVEDESEILKLAKIILERYGYSVFATAKPDAALTLAQQHPGPIHLLITDVVMPMMNGKELKDRIVALRPEIKVLFMSGYTPEAIDRHGMLEKGVPRLQKPFSVKVFAATVRKVLDKGKKLKAKG